MQKPANRRLAGELVLGCFSREDWAANGMRERFPPLKRATEEKEPAMKTMQSQPTTGSRGRAECLAVSCPFAPSSGTDCPCDRFLRRNETAFAGQLPQRPSMPAHPAALRGRMGRGSSKRRAAVADAGSFRPQACQRPSQSFKPARRGLAGFVNQTVCFSRAHALRNAICALQPPEAHRRQALSLPQSPWRRLPLPGGIWSAALCVRPFPRIGAARRRSGEPAARPPHHIRPRRPQGQSR